MWVTSMAMPAAPSAATALPALKAEPAHPEHAGAGDGHGQIVRRHGRIRKAAATAEHQRGHQRGHAGCDVDHRAAGKIAKTDVGEPTVAPDPMGHGEVDQHHPCRDKDQHGGKPHAFCNTAHEQRGSNDREGQLEHDEHGFRIGPAERIHPDPAEPGLAQAADVSPDSFTERQAVAANDPDDRNKARDGKALHDHGEHVAIPDQSGIEQRQAGQRHEQHQGSGRQHPGGVARIKRLTEADRRPQGYRQGGNGC